MQKGHVLALDYGSKRVGVASGDFEFKIAFPREIIVNRGFTYVSGRIKVLCAELNVVKIIVGYPFNMKTNQKKSVMMKAVEVFVEKLKKDFMEQGIKGIEVLLFDERLSSFEAHELMDKFSSNQKGKRKPVDQTAAQIILQRYFDNLTV